MAYGSLELGVQTNPPPLSYFLSRYIFTTATETNLGKLPFCLLSSQRGRIKNNQSLCSRLFSLRSPATSFLRDGLSDFAFKDRGENTFLCQLWEGLLLIPSPASLGCCAVRCGARSSPRAMLRSSKAIPIRHLARGYLKAPAQEILKVREISGVALCYCDA